MDGKHSYILGAARTPIGNFGGVFKTVSATELGAYAISGAIRRASLSPAQIEEVLMGCVLSAGLGQAPARQAALAAQVPTQVPCTTLNKMCGSGMKALMIAHDEIQANSFQAIVAGGMESMSQTPYLIPKARFGYRLGHGQLIDHMMLDGLEDAYEPGKSMGHFAELCVDDFKFSREQLDEFATRSLMRAKAASRDGEFSGEIEPVILKDRNGEGFIQHDENPQVAKPERIKELKPAFRKDGRITAANASSISDGAAAIVLSSEPFVMQHHLTPLAKLLAHTSFATAPSQFTTAPIDAIESLLTKCRWRVSDVDLFEINEAFAVVTLAAIQRLQLDINKVNVNGGACALGHPIGASGARIVVTLLHALKNRGLKRGVAALCIGGGEATAIAVEML